MGKNLLDYATSLDPAQAQMLSGKQAISEIKYDTVTLAAAALPPQTAFFAVPSADLAIKNFDAQNVLITSGKLFLIQTIAAQITAIAAAATAQNLVDLINRCAVRFTVDQKIMGTFQLKALSGMGGAYLPSQVAVAAAAAPAGAASNFGITNGMPTNQPFRVRPMLIEGQKQFACTLVAPVGAPITLAGAIDLQIMLGGVQFQAIQ